MPDIEDDVRLDTSQVEDRRGQRGIGGGLAIGGGGIGLVVTLLLLLLGGGNLTGGSGSPLDSLDDLTTAGQPPAESSLAQDCQTGADAEKRQDCRMVAFVNSIQEYWTRAYASGGERYTPATTTFFSGSVRTACGTASSQVGPFYCPLDKKVYIELGFFDQLRKLGASSGSFAEAYVLAHEYGHHIQTLEGILGQIGNDREGPQSKAVRAELQADCLAGVWASNAAGTGIIASLSDQDITDALSAAASVGDDRIQKQTQGRVTPESWTHGSSEQRQKWFTQGYRSGNFNSCDTFSGGI